MADFNVYTKPLPGLMEVDLEGNKFYVDQSLTEDQVYDAIAKYTAKPVAPPSSGFTGFLSGISQNPVVQAAKSVVEYPGNVMHNMITKGVPAAYNKFVEEQTAPREPGLVPMAVMDLLRLPGSINKGLAELGPDQAKPLTELLLNVAGLGKAGKMAMGGTPKYSPFMVPTEAPVPRGPLPLAGRVGEPLALSPRGGTGGPYPQTVYTAPPAKRLNVQVHENPERTWVSGRMTETPNPELMRDPVTYPVPDEYANMPLNTGEDVAEWMIKNKGPDYPTTGRPRGQIEVAPEILGPEGAPARYAPELPISNKETVWSVEHTPPPVPAEFRSGNILDLPGRGTPKTGGDVVPQVSDTLRATSVNSNAAGKKSFADLPDWLNEDLQQIAPDEYGFLGRAGNRYYRDPKRVARLSEDTALGRGMQLSDERREVMSRLNTKLNDEAGKIAKTIPQDELEATLKMLDTEGGAQLAATQLSPEAQVGYAGLRRILNDVADAMGLDRDMKISDYFPKNRLNTEIRGQRYLTMEDSYVPKETLMDASSKWQPWFLKERTADEGLPSYDLKMLENYFRGVSNRIATMGGREPLGDTPIRGLIPGLKEENVLGQLKDKNIPYAQEYFNNLLGAGQSNANVLSNEASKAATNAMYGAKLGPYLGQALGNLTQIGLMASKVSPGSFIHGGVDWLKLLGNAEGRAALRNEFGINPNFNRPDLGVGNTFNKNPVEKAGHIMATPFRTSQTITEEVSALQAVREADRLGLTGPAKHDYVRDMLLSTQRWGTPENVPLAWQNMSPGTRVVMQFKNFPRAYANYIQDVARTDLDNLPNTLPRAAEQWNRLTSATGPVEFSKELLNTIDVVPFSGLAKQIATVGLIGGTDALTGGMDKVLSEYFTGDRNKYTQNGLAQALGLHVGYMLGMGALPVENMSSLAFFLPGPMVSTVMDIASAVATGVSGEQYEITPGNIANGTVSKGPVQNWPRIMDKLIRDTPIVGPPIAMGAKAVRNYRAGNQEEITQPNTMAEYFGVTPMPETARKITPKEPYQMIYDLTNTRSPRQEAAGDIGRVQQSEEEEKAQATTVFANRAAESGDIEGVLKMIEEYNRDKPEHRKIYLSPQAMESAITRAHSDRSTQMLNRAPDSMKTRILDLLKELE